MTSMIGYQGPTGGNLRGTATPGPRGAGEGDIIPKGYRKGQLNQFTPEQMGLFESLFGQLGPDSYLSKLSQGDEETFNQLEAPELRQFSGLQGSIASRFSQGAGGAGALSSRRSSGHQNAQNAAASNFAQELAARRGELQRQATTDLWGMAQQLLGQRPTENILTPKAKKRTFLEGLLESSAPAFAQGVGESIGKGAGGSNSFFGGG